MNQKNILFAVAAIALLMSGATLAQRTVYTPDDFFSNLIEYDAGISDGYAVFEIKNPTPDLLTVTPEMLYSYVRSDIAKQSTSVTSIKYFELQYYNVTTSDVDCQIITNGTFGNSSARTDTQCTKIQRTHEESSWQRIKAFSIPSGSSKKLRVEVSYLAKLGPNAHDWMPALNFLGEEIKQTKWIWFNTSYSRRMQINISLYRANDTVEVNLTSLGITCSNTNCTDVVMTDANDAELRFPDGNKAWQIPLDNISSRNKPNNDFVVFSPQNSSLVYWIYYNNTGTNNTGGSIILWEDNFERYSVGNIPLKMTSSLNGTGYVCTASGQKGAGCNVTGGAFIAFQVTNFTNVTVQWEINNSASFTNSLILNIFGNNSYRAPQIVATNSYQMNLQGGTNLSQAIAYTGTSAGYNITSYRAGSNIGFIINHVIRANGSDTTRTNGAEVGFQPSGNQSSLLSIQIWNMTVDTQATEVNITNSSIQNFNTTGTANFAITAYVEDSEMLVLTNASLSIFNSTTTQTYSLSNGIANLNVNSLPQGPVSLYFQQNDQIRKYYMTIVMTIVNDTNQSLNIFFPNTTQAYFFTFTTRSGSSLVNGSLLTFQRYVNNTFRTVAQGFTQVDGTDVVYLEPNIIHRVIVTNALYQTKTFDYTFSAVLAGSPINIPLTPIGGSGGFPAVNTFIDSNILLSWQPSFPILSNATNVNVTLSDSAGLINSLVINVTRYNLSGNRTTFFYTNLTGSQSYTQNVSISTEGFYDFNIYLTRNSTLYQTTKQYSYFSKVSGGPANLNFTAIGEKPTGLSLMFWQILALVLLAIVAAGLYPIAGPTGTIFMVMIGFALCGYWSIFNIYQTILLELLCLVALKVTA